jgi:putative acetyltransferase
LKGFGIITIQAEKEEDFAATHEINVLAFGQENEARLVKKIREAPDFITELSLVAIKKGKVVGHILFSRITIQSKIGSFPALALAPMAIHPEFQNQGIGSKLVRQGLEHCRNQGYKIVIVIGHPQYYPHFGFSAARAKGLEVSFSVPDEVFMVLELFPDALNGTKGMVTYPPEFLDG